MADSKTQQNKTNRWFWWIVALCVVSIHLIAMVIVSYQNLLQTHKHHTQLDQNKQLIQLISHYELEESFLKSYPKIDDWANDNQFITEPKNHTIIDFSVQENSTPK